MQHYIDDKGYAVQEPSGTGIENTERYHVESLKKVARTVAMQCYQNVLKMLLRETRTNPGGVQTQYIDGDRYDRAHGVGGSWDTSGWIDESYAKKQNQVVPFELFPSGTPVVGTRIGFTGKVKKDPERKIHHRFSTSIIKRPTASGKSSNKISFARGVHKSSRKERSVREGTPYP